MANVWKATAYTAEGKIRRMFGDMLYTEGLIDEISTMLEDESVVSIKLERVRA